MLYNIVSIAIVFLVFIGLSAVKAKLKKLARNYCSNEQ